MALADDRERDLLKMKEEADCVSALVVESESNGMQMTAAGIVAGEVPNGSCHKQAEQHSPSFLQPPITGFMAHRQGVMLPQFPVLPTQIPATPFHFDLLADVQDIAKEALRLTKETLYRHEKNLGELEFDHFSRLLFCVPVLSHVKNLSPEDVDVSPDVSQEVSRDGSIGSHDARPMPLPRSCSTNSGSRLNKFVRRLHDMLVSEKESGVVEWRRGVLVLIDTDAFSKKLLPKHFNTRNFKTFRRQLNYYGFVHVRSFTNLSSKTTALWVNRELAHCSEKPDDVSSVLSLKRVEPCETAKTVEGRRARKELALTTVQEDLAIASRSIYTNTVKPWTSANPLCDGKSPRKKRKIVLEHHDHESLTSSIIVSDDIMTTSTVIPCPRALESHADHDSESKPNPPTSNVSAANLLLLLSKA
jgi:hypothetical protein